MKMFYGNTPINSMKIKHYEVSTNDCDMIASDLQAGKTAVARGKKITGTGKSFEFACYGDFESNDGWFVPANINVILISCINYPVQTLDRVVDTNYLDFSIEQNVGNLVADNKTYPIKASVVDNILSITCDKEATFQVFYGKDNYI